MKCIVHASGTSYEEGTPPDLIEVLESARVRHLRLRFFYGDVVTGKDHHEAIEEAGYLGRSTGPQKMLLIQRCSTSVGGPLLMTQHLVKVTSVGRDQEVRGKPVIHWKHPKYHQDVFYWRKSLHPDFEFELLRNERIHCRFKTARQMKGFLKRMQIEPVQPEMLSNFSIDNGHSQDIMET